MKTLITIAAIVMLVLSGMVGYLLDKPEAANFEAGRSPNSPYLYKTVTPLDSVTSSTTSGVVNIEGARRVTLYIDHDVLTDLQGTTTFDVDVSVDGTNYVDYKKLIDNVTNTNSQTPTRVETKVYDTNTSGILSMDLQNDIFKYFKVNSVITDGSTTTTATVFSLIEY